ncbi:CdaR family protein [Virgibacillus sp. W0430]|uniref:CdaR family protein n=1 Tax=Virgibacillus sp. W0430 TaxID=3391580 RepID=UPI003F44C44B
MDNWFKSKWFVRIVSLAFAISLYVFVSIEIDDSKDDSRIFPGVSQDTQTLDDVPVEIKIDADRYVVSGVPEFVLVTLEGANSVLTPTVRQRNFSVFVDLQDLGEGEHTVEIEYANLPNDLSVYIEPKTIDVVIEERSSKEFAITIDLLNEDQLPVGYELGKPTISPDTVTIISSKNIIDQIAMVKVFVDVSGLTESINSRELPINVYDSQGNELNVRVEPENTVLSLSVDNPSKIVPLDVPTKNELPEGYELTSIKAELEELEIFSTSDVLKDIERVSTEAIDLSNIKESGTIKVPLSLGKNVIASVDEIEVEIEIEQTKELTDVSIHIDGTEEENVAFIEPNNPIMSVIAVGNEKNVRDIKAEDILVSINTSGLGVGEHQVPVLINGPEQVTYQGEYEEVTIEVK